jgi:hypothetical protein
MKAVNAVPIEGPGRTLLVMLVLVCVAASGRAAKLKANFNCEKLVNGSYGGALYYFLSCGRIALSHTIYKEQPQIFV